MTTARPRFNDQPRGLTKAEAAGLLGHGEGWLTDKRLNQLYSTGFPRPDPILERFDRVAIDSWLDRRSGLSGGEYDDGLSRRLEEFGHDTAA